MRSRRSSRRGRGSGARSGEEEGPAQGAKSCQDSRRQCCSGKSCRGPSPSSNGSNLNRMYLFQDSFSTKSTGIDSHRNEISAVEAANCSRSGRGDMVQGRHADISGNVHQGSTYNRHFGGNYSELAAVVPHSSRRLRLTEWLQRVHRPPASTPSMRPRSGSCGSPATRRVDRSSLYL